ncbi:MAG: hypothetical protein FJX74_08275 [Armatimonadetes bacterium]|nr:hypothetical protein [Armatimonadota bacterium]
MVATCSHCGSSLPDPNAQCEACAVRARMAQRRATDQPDATERMIPYRNPAALVAYYVGIAGIIPCVGLICAAISIPAGIMGLQAARDQPRRRGTAHAWVGIIVGVVSIVLHIGGYLWLRTQ